MNGSRALVAAPLAALMMLALGACKATVPASRPSSGKSASLQAMEQVAMAAHRCWFASADKAFSAYRMANELNSFSGRPRFLVVPSGDYEGLPLLVVQAEGESRRIEFFGPLLEGSLGPRITADLQRWQRGDTSCTQGV
ncbi:hypothetical protein NYR54_11875 [Chelativorans sp. SCAU2101]|jgi:hypothetical protein|uniref:Lipoprotein n=1 Tax=Chelativorans petroleitrophicus TaxID=2975484 RepID=A0A9X3AZZ8_9HYPH|nr:hypothetical protein [Chelativorans petroleitrophicus]MCT8990980.1 hypothetical protein [Chelativorans petroleitrophicus]